jgi:hypothetical protein
MATMMVQLLVPIQKHPTMPLLDTILIVVSLNLMDKSKKILNEVGQKSTVFFDNFRFVLKNFDTRFSALLSICQNRLVGKVSALICYLWRKKVNSFQKTPKSFLFQLFIVPYIKINYNSYRILTRYTSHLKVSSVFVAVFTFVALFNLIQP